MAHLFDEVPDNFRIIVPRIFGLWRERGIMASAELAAAASKTYDAIISRRIAGCTSSTAAGAWPLRPGLRGGGGLYLRLFLLGRAAAGLELERAFRAPGGDVRYLNHVADRFDLRRDIQCNSRVSAAVFNEAMCQWEVTLDSGERFAARFLITAWPHEPVDFTGKRVAVIGAGATGVQVIQTIAPLVGALTVFQRTPNWCTPLHNRKITEEEQRKIKAGYPAMFELLRQTPGCYIHNTDPRGTFEVTAEEREAFWEKLYSEPGFGIWMANFRDVLTDPKANALFSGFVARKIRQRVKDPAVAERLIPKCHGFGTRRVPQETGYYEAYNLPHDRDTEYAFDMIIYATGFDAITGAFDRIEFPRHGRPEAEGPLGGRAEDLSRPDVGGVPEHADHCRAAQRLHPLQHPALHRAERGLGDRPDARARDRRITRFEATPEAEAEWSRHIEELAEGMLYTQIDSWATASIPMSRVGTCDASCSIRAAHRHTGHAATRLPPTAI
ncbi:MAG: hypothetical protein FRX48_09860 [Lasallia pustulata]|uniref:Phenylacetone monooxygenase n=1 Tax=Lasallia pustulata TaxID=136370 RepID=A0A5M8PBP3_9LECA|nr:MAG: hypothetical protein FRX48_09860 [Lasallia pustulata]